MRKRNHYPPIVTPDDHWPVQHRKLRVRKKYRNRWAYEARNFRRYFNGRHTRYEDWVKEQALVKAREQS